jgi:LCP family protein required for cell wall assembly
MIEDELRATFARHEDLAPSAGTLRAAIDRIAARRRRRRNVVRTTTAALAVLAVVSVPVLQRTLAAIPAAIDVLPAGSPDGSTGPDAALNFLLLGVDGEAVGDNTNRADSVLIVHVPRDRSRVYLVALPRDLGVDIPGYRFGKLSEAFYHGSDRSGATPDLAGGARLTARTVAGLTGLTFDGTAVLTFDGLRQLTDAIGGVRLCLPTPVQSWHTKRVYPAGCQQFNGAAALDLLRQRWGLAAGAYDRDRNAQRFAAALLASVTSSETLTNPIRLSALLRAGGDGLSIDTGKLPLGDLLSLVSEVRGTEPVGIGWEFNTTEVGGVLYEQLDPALSGSLFDALHGDTLAGWVAAHPDRVTR